jgi:chromosome segregation ATPase
MHDMTPEERFTKIENLLATVAEYQAMQAENQARRDAEIDKHNAEIDKHNAALRDLVAISRTLIDSHKLTATEISQLRESIAKLRDRQEATGEKLHILIETVDRIIRNK